MTYRKLFFALNLCFVTFQLGALPIKGKVKAGDVSIKADGHMTQKSDRAIVQFDNFSIGEKERVVISQPSSTSALLNRVTGSCPSKIDGELLANGRVYLINPQGVIVGPSGCVKTAEFVASTLDIADREFLEQNSFHFRGDSDRKIVHMGTIEALEGDVCLFARVIEQSGDIVARHGEIHLIGTSAIFLSPGGKCLVQVDDSKNIEEELRASGGSALSLAMNLEGIVESSVLCSGKLQGSKVNIQGKQIHLLESTTIDASKDFGGGEVLIGSDRSDVQVDSGARIFASALLKGNGGTVLVLGNETSFSGEISSRGGELGGDGGFVEVSGYQGFMYSGKTDTQAPKGKFGTLLLDPSDITISTASSNPSFPPDSTKFEPAGLSGILNHIDLQTNLGSSNILVTTAKGTGGSGNITWVAEAPVSWSAPTTLTLRADRAMSLASDITNTGSGSFTAMNFSANAEGTGAGSFTGLTVLGTAKLLSAEGAISLSGRGGDMGNSNYGVNILGMISSTDTAPITITGYGKGGVTTDTSYGVRIAHTGSVNAINTNAITITGTGGLGDDRNHGVEILGPVSSTGTAPISITGTGGGGSTGSDDNFGVHISGSSVTSSDGPIEIIGKPSQISGGSDRNHGIQIDSSGKVRSTGTATISLSGTGVTGTGGVNRGVFLTGVGSEVTSVSGDISITGTGGSGGNANVGVCLASSAQIKSNGTAGITITGIGGTGDKNNDGIELASGSIIASFDGSISLTGTGHGSGKSCHGISFVGESTGVFYGGNGSGSVTLIGTGGGTSGHGIDINGGAGVTAGSSSSKPVSITATGSGAAGIDISDPIGGVFATGDLTFTTDTIDIKGASIQTTGEILFQPRSPSTSIGLGGGTGAFNLSDVELGTIAEGATRIIFGRVDGTSIIRMGAFSSFNAPVIFRNESFALTGDIASVAGTDFTVIANSATLGAGDTITTSGTITFKPLSLSRQMNLGTGSNGGLYLSNQELDQLIGGDLVFGDINQTGAAHLRAYAYAHPVTVYSDTIWTSGVVSGSDVALHIGCTGNNGFAYIDTQPTSTTTVTGGSGTNTLTGRSSGSTWSVTSTGGGTLNTTVSFINMQNLVGGSGGSDTFSFANEGSINGTINGGTNVSGNTLDYSSHTDPVRVNLGSSTATGMDGFSNIEEFIGGPITSTLTGKNIPNTWLITSNNAGTVNGTPFSSFHNLIGGTVTNALIFSDGVAVSGSIDGTSASGNSFDFSAYTTDVSVDLSRGISTGGGFSNIQTFTGGTGSNTITGPNSSNTWTLTGANKGIINGHLSFSAFGSLFGGGESDLFDLSLGPFVNAINGSGGANTLRAPNGFNNWEITSDNAGTVEGISFSNIGSLIGGTAQDTFIFSDQVNLLGSVQGGSPSSLNILDYRLFTIPALIQFTTQASGTASNLGGGFSEIGFVTGNFGTRSEVLTLDRSFISKIGVALAGINSFEPYYEPRTIQYRQFSPLNRITTLPTFRRKMSYAPGVMGQLEK